MKNFRVLYDEEDILYLEKPGREEDVIELAPGVNVELNKSGKLIGIEIFKALELLKNASSWGKGFNLSK